MKKTLPFVCLIILFSLIGCVSTKTSESSNKFCSDEMYFFEARTPNAICVDAKSYVKSQLISEDLNNTGDVFAILSNRKDYEQLKIDYPDYDFIIDESDSIFFDSDKPLFLCNPIDINIRVNNFIYIKSKQYAYGECREKWYIDFLEVYSLSD